MLQTNAHSIFKVAYKRLGTQWLMNSLLHPEVVGASVDEHGKYGPVSRARKGKKAVYPAC